MTHRESKLKQLINKALLLGEEELKSAQNGDWEKVEQQEIERQKVNRQAFSLDIKGGDQEFARSAIGKIKTIEKAILLLAEHSKEQASKELKKSQKGNKATQIYQQFR